MTVLSDHTIQRLVGEMDLICPFDQKKLQPASYDLTLEHLLDLDGGLWYSKEIMPGEFILGSTIEKVSIPANMVARIEGKSSWARRGLIVHTAGFIDPGFVGNLTLEITNLGPKPVYLDKGIRISQLAFQFLDLPANRPYGHPELGSHYQFQEGARRSAIS